VLILSSLQYTSKKMEGRPTRLKSGLGTFCKKLEEKSFNVGLHAPSSSKVATSQTFFLRLKKVVLQLSCSNMCTSLEVMSGGERGREEDKFLTFKVSCMWIFNFSFKREFESNRQGRGRKEGGGGR